MPHNRSETATSAVDADTCWQPQQEVAHDRSRAAKAPIACDRCRLKKIKCDGSRPCKGCLNYSAECHYARSGRRQRGPAKKNRRLLEKRLEHAERLLWAFGVSPSRLSSPTPLDRREGQNRLLEHTELSQSSEDGTRNSHTDAQTSQPCLTRTRQPTHYQTPESIITCPTTVGTSCLDIGIISASILDGAASYHPSAPGPPDSASAPLIQQDDSSTRPSPIQLDNLSLAHEGVLLNQNTTTDTRQNLSETEGGGDNEPANQDQIHGPNSYLSICLNPGMEWIASKICTPGFRASATSLLCTINGNLKLGERTIRGPVPEPNRALAQLYTKAYFDESLEATYCIVDQPSFESRLRHHLDSPYESDTDLAWYALRNIVFAIGCKIHTFRTRSWLEAQQEARGYFENALSVETNLIHGASALSEIRAVFLMALAAEGLGSPTLEHMLVGCAVRLAHVRGLHRRPASSRVAPEHVQERSWLFWSIYCFEKHLSIRIGGPSIINDDDISCDLPTGAPGATSDYVLCFKHCVSLSRLSSTIIRNFTTVKAQEQTPLQKAKSVREMDACLKDWYKDLPQGLKHISHGTRAQDSEGIRPEHLLYLHFAYQTNLSVIHSIFGYPWNHTSTHDYQHGIVEEQIATSSEALRLSSQAIILAVRSISVDAVAPAWLAFYYPLVGMINMFVSILKKPDEDGTASDVGLLGMAAGHFSYLEYATQSTVSLPCIRDLPHWAREAVTKDQPTEATRDTSRPVVHSGQLSSGQSQLDCLDIPYEVDFTMDQMDFDQWPMFLPCLPQVN